MSHRKGYCGRHTNAQHYADTELRVEATVEVADELEPRRQDRTERARVAAEARSWP